MIFETVQRLARERDEARAERDAALALAATCSCGTSPMTYEGPEPDCAVHGAVRAFNLVTEELAQAHADMANAQSAHTKTIVDLAVKEMQACERAANAEEAARTLEGERDEAQRTAEQWLEATHRHEMKLAAMRPVVEAARTIMNAATAALAVGDAGFKTVAAASVAQLVYGPIVAVLTPVLAVVDQMEARTACSGPQSDAEGSGVAQDVQEALGAQTGAQRADAVPIEELRALFDLAVNCMDFGSGFWDTEETEAARAIAVRLGVDPMEATPSNMRTHFGHAFRPNESGVPRWAGTCHWCSRPEADHA